MSVFEDIKRGLEQAIAHKQKGNNNMIEIIGEHMMPVFEQLHIFPKIVYSGSVGHWHHFEVWELNEEEFRILTDTFDGEAGDAKWNQIAPEGSWWRYAEGSNMGKPTEFFTVNGKPLCAWRNEHRVHDLAIEYNELPVEEKNEYVDFDDYCSVWLPSKQHEDILSYFSDEIGASTEGNVCALVTDIAKYNNMTVAEVFKNYV